MLATVLDRSEEYLPGEASARRVSAAVLSQQVGGRNWSAQEVGHVNMGCRTIISSHIFETVYLAGKRKMLRPDITSATPGDEPAFLPNALDKYFERIKSLEGAKLLGPTDPDQLMLIQQGFGQCVDPFRIDKDHVLSCSRKHNEVKLGKCALSKDSVRIAILGGTA